MYTGIGKVWRNDFMAIQVAKDRMSFGGDGFSHHELSAQGGQKKGGLPMKYLLLVSHGTMAPGVHSVIRMLLGDRDDVLSYSMEDGVSADEYVAGLSKVIEPIQADDTVLVLGDIVGGSPLTNALNTLTQKGLLAQTLAFGGLSLPMAISALMAIDDGLDDATLEQSIVEEATAGIRKVELALDEDDEEDL